MGELLVSIEKYSSNVLTGGPYIIKADTVTHAMQRAATQTGLPGDQDTKVVTIFGLDLGICTESISISGIVDEIPVDASEPSKHQLEDVIRTWWNTDANTTEDVPWNYQCISIDQPAGVKRRYWGLFQSANFRKTGGIEDRWEFEIAFLTLAYTDGNLV